MSHTTFVILMFNQCKGILICYNNKHNLVTILISDNLFFDDNHQILTSKELRREEFFILFCSCSWGCCFRNRPLRLNLLRFIDELTRTIILCHRLLLRCKVNAPSSHASTRSGCLINSPTLQVVISGQYLLSVWAVALCRQCKSEAKVTTRSMIV